MATPTELQAMYLRHVQAFLHEAVGDQIEKTDETIHDVLKITFGPADQQKATGLGAAIAELWEKILPSLLLFCDSEEKKARLMEVVWRLAREQVVELSKALTGEAGPAASEKPHSK